MMRSVLYEEWPRVNVHRVTTIQQKPKAAPSEIDSQMMSTAFIVPPSNGRWTGLWWALGAGSQQHQDPQQHPGCDRARERPQECVEADPRGYLRHGGPALAKRPVTSRDKIKRTLRLPQSK
jgi:hypothetical protein